MTTTTKPPQAVLDAFIEATIRNDFNAMASLLGETERGETLSNQTFGPLLGEALQTQGQAQAQDVRRFKWTVTDLKTSGAFTHATVHLNIPDYGAIARRADELMGVTYATDGTMHLPKQRIMSEEEADQRAEVDPRIPPLKYRVRVELVQRKGQWIINPNVQENLALVRILQEGNVRAENERYQQRP